MQAGPSADLQNTMSAAINSISKVLEVRDAATLIVQSLLVT